MGHSSPERPTSFFVYGTLKRGQLRDSMWPRQPLEVRAATIRATLHDLGPYPAITDGDDVVAGEIWTFRKRDVDTTIQVLDEIECYQQDETDLYIRRIINCQTNDNVLVSAFAYFYANSGELSLANRISPNEDGLSRWPSRD